MDSNSANIQNLKKQDDLPVWLELLIIIGGAILIGYLLTKLFEYLFSSWGSEDEVRPRVFISHSWKYDKDYWNLINKFDKQEFRFYNHSIDVDKSLDANTSSQIIEGIKKKMQGCSKVLVLAGNYADRYWIKKEVEIANKMGKEVIAIRPWGNKNVPSYLKKHANKIIGFNSSSIIEKIKN